MSGNVGKVIPTVFGGLNGTLLPITGFIGDENGFAVLQTSIYNVTNILPEDQVLLFQDGTEVTAQDYVAPNSIFLFDQSVFTDTHSTSQQLPVGDEINQLQPFPVFKLNPIEDKDVDELQSVLSSDLEYAGKVVQFGETYLANVSRAVQKISVQMMAWQSVINNLAQYVRSTVEKFSSFQASSLVDLKKYEALIQSFPQDVQIMKSIPVFPELLPPDNRTSQSSSKKSVADFLPIEKLERWAAHCTEIFKHFNSKLHVVTEAVQQIQNGYQLAVDTYTEMFAEESQIRMIGTNDLNHIVEASNLWLEEVKKIETLCSIECSNVQQGMTIGSQYSQNRERNYATLTAKPETLTPLLSYHNDITHNLKNQLYVVSEYQSQISNTFQDFEWLLTAKPKLTNAFEQLIFVSRVPASLGCAIFEVQRRNVWEEILMQKAHAIAQAFATIVEAENNRRSDFKSEIIPYVPFPFPGLDSNPPLVEVTCSGTKTGKTARINMSHATELEELILNLRSSFEKDTASASITGSQRIPDSLGKLQATIMKMHASIDTIGVEINRNLFQVLDIPLSDTAHMASSFHTMQTSRKDTTQKELEEKVKAYEERIRELEAALKQSYIASTNSRITSADSSGTVPPRQLPIRDSGSHDSARSSDSECDESQNERNDINEQKKALESQMNSLVQQISEKDNLILELSERLETALSVKPSARKLDENDQQDGDVLESSSRLISGQFSTPNEMSSVEESPLVHLQKCIEKVLQDKTTTGELLEKHFIGIEVLKERIRVIVKSIQRSELTTDEADHTESTAAKLIKDSQSFWLMESHACDEDVQSNDRDGGNSTEVPRLQKRLEKDLHDIMKMLNLIEDNISQHKDAD